MKEECKEECVKQGQIKQKEGECLITPAKLHKTALCEKFLMLVHLKLTRYHVKVRLKG